jgi:hypothetical protein
MDPLTFEPIRKSHTSASYRFNYIFNIKKELPSSESETMPFQARRLFTVALILMIIDTMFRHLDLGLWILLTIVFLFTCILIWSDAMFWVLRQSDEEKEELRASFEKLLV